LTGYQRSSSIYHDGFDYIEKLTKLDLITRRYDNVLLALPTLKKHQRRNKDGSIINTPDPEHGDKWTSLENELYQWRRELLQQECEETKNYCESRINRINDQMRRRGYDPEI
tara:strand:+ start:639 stop:974 length:336 start_codon:yes stop_codon:yes gene_type:complete